MVNTRLCSHVIWYIQRLDQELKAFVGLITRFGGAGGNEGAWDVEELVEATKMKESRVSNLQGYIAVSEVGRLAMGSSRSDWPLMELLVDLGITSRYSTHARVTQATSGEKPSMWSFSRSKTF